MRVAPIVIALTLLACREPARKAPGASASATPNATPIPIPTPTPTRTSNPTPTSPPIPATAAVLGDAGPSSCKLLPAPLDAGELGLPTSCVRTKNHAFCVDDHGKVTRGDPSGASGAVIATARPGTRIAAADVGAHDVVAFLAERRTPDGIMLQAFASIDGGPPSRVSEDGTGATSVDIAPRGARGVLSYVDARGAMAPVHARALAEVGGKIEVGKDAVVFLGGAPDPYVAGRLGTTPDQAVVVVPISKDATSFGMAIVKLDDPPRDDEPVAWAMYPYGLDPAPIALTHGVAPIRVARLVPKAAGPNAPRAVELGAIDARGEYQATGFSIDHDHCGLLSIAVESASGPGAVLLVRHGDADAAIVDRVRCVP